MWPKKKESSENAYPECDPGRVYIALFPVRADLLAFWVPACICSVSHPFSGVWVQPPRQAVHRMEPGRPEAGVSSSLAPKGHSHHTHQFSSQETNAHPSPRHLHVLPHRQVIGESFSTASCSHWVLLSLAVFVLKSKEDHLVRGRRIRVKVAGTFFGGKELFGLQISSFFFPVSWGSEGRGRPWCAGFCWFDYLPALSLST